MAAPKVRDLITEAFREAGVLGLGQSLKAEDVQGAFRRLNWMLSQWQRKRWMIYALKDYPVVSTGAVYYTVGPGGNIDVTPRPDKVHSAYLRYVGGGDFSKDFDDDFNVVNANAGTFDFNLQILQSREDYNRIINKAFTGQSCYLFYEPSFPLGRAFAWPLPQTTRWELQLTFKTPLQSFASINDTISMPDEYFAALHYALTVRLAAAYRKVLPDATLGLARDAMNVVRNANTQVPSLKMPAHLQNVPGYRSYSWWW